MSDLLHYQACCNKERVREREETGEGEAGARAFGDVSGPTFSDRACVHGHGGGSFLGMHQSVRLGTDASVGFSHPRTLHARRVRVACLLFVHQTLPVFLCVFIHALQMDVR